MQKTLNTGSKIKQMDHFLNNFSAFGFSGTVLVAEGDKILLNKGYGFRNYEESLPMVSDTIMSIGSISKQFTATLIMRLLDQGEISVDDPLSQYFDVDPEKPHSRIRISQLLNHTSGAPPFLSSGTDFDAIDADTFVHEFFETDLQFNPGTDYQYSNVGYSILGILVEKLTGVTYQKTLLDLMREIGAEHVGWFGDPRWDDDSLAIATYYTDGDNNGSIATWQGAWEQPYWHILGNGGVCLPTKQLFTWIRSLMSGDIISNESLELMLTPEEKDQYGYGWRIVDSPLGSRIQHNGGNDLGVNAIAKYYRDHELTFLIFSNRQDNGFGYAEMLEDMLEVVLTVGEVPFDLPTEITGVQKSDLIIGEYEFEGDKSNRIIIEENRLGEIKLHATGQLVLNSILHPTQERKHLYNIWNTTMNTVGSLFYDKDWEAAFSYFLNKDVSDRRVNLLTNLRQAIERDVGTIQEITSGGSMPFSDYEGMTHLNYIGKRGSAGIPFVWQDEDTILGFRPLITNYPLTLTINQVDDSTFVGFNALYNCTLHFTIPTQDTIELDKNLFLKKIIS